MLFDCYRVQDIWVNMSNSLKIELSWKNIVCGFPKYSMCTSKKINVINVIISVIAYAIFKENSYCKFEHKNYSNVNLCERVKQNLVYYKTLSELVSKDTLQQMMFDIVLKGVQ